MILAPDPAVPRRNSLLRPATMAGVLSRRLHAGVPVERCELFHVKYRVGESLRVVYRYRVRGAIHHTAARSAIGASFYPYPHDRKLAALPQLAALDQVLGVPVTTRLVAYAAEQSATAECRDPRGQVIAYAKVSREAPRSLDQTTVRTPRVLATGDVTLLEALAGTRLDRLADDERALHEFGKTLAQLHSLPADGERFARLDPSRLVTAAEVISVARPDVAGPAAALVTRLLDRVEDSERPRRAAARGREPAQRDPAPGARPRGAARSRGSLGRAGGGGSRAGARVAAERARGGAARRLRRDRGRCRTARACAGSRPPRCSRGSRCPPSPASGRSCSRGCARCWRPRHEARAALLLPAQRRARPPDAQLRVVRPARGAVPGDAARRRPAPAGHRPAAQRRARRAAAARRQRQRVRLPRRALLHRARVGAPRRSRSRPRCTMSGPASSSSSCSRSGGRSSRASWSRCSRTRSSSARSPPAASETSWSAATSSATTRPASAPTASWTPCSCTATRASRGSRRRSSRARRSRRRSTTRASSPAATESRSRARTTS